MHVSPHTHTLIHSYSKAHSHNSRRACHLLSMQHCISTEADGAQRRICSTACCVHVEQAQLAISVGPWAVVAKGHSLLSAISQQQRYLFRFICIPRSLIFTFYTQTHKADNFIRVREGGLDYPHYKTYVCIYHDLAQWTTAACVCHNHFYEFNFQCPSFCVVWFICVLCSTNGRTKRRQQCPLLISSWETERDTGRDGERITWICRCLSMG